MKKIKSILFNLVFITSAFSIEQTNHSPHSLWDGIITADSISNLSSNHPEDEIITFIETNTPYICKTTDNKMGNIANHGFCQPEFINDVFSKPKQEVLEIGPGDGIVLEQILKDARNLNCSIRYTAVDPCKSHLDKINSVILRENKNPENWFGRSTKNAQDFILNKQDKYDLIFCAQVLHFLNPLEQLSVLNGFRKSLKINGKLYVITNGIHSLNIWILSKNKDSIKEQEKIYQDFMILNQKNGELWPGYFLDHHLDIPRFTSQWITSKTFGFTPYGIPNLHTLTSLKKLVSDLEMTPIDIKNFSEYRKNDDYAPSIRIGLIAQKTTDNEPNEEKIRLYEKEGIQKIESVENMTHTYAKAINFLKKQD